MKLVKYAYCKYYTPVYGNLIEITNAYALAIICEAVLNVYVLMYST